MKMQPRSGLNLLIAALLFFTMRGGSGAAELPDRFVLEGVSFINDSTTLEEISGSVLQELLQELLTDPSVSIQIKCHVAPSGDKRHDSKLSQSRAEVLRRWFMTRGVAFYRVIVADADNSTSISKPPSQTNPPADDWIEIVRTRPSLPIADFPARAFRFEPVVDGQEVLHDFQLQNRGDAPLNISRVRTG